MSKRAVLFAVFLSTAATIHLGASVPLGVYAVVDKVVMEPSDADPQRVQVWGAFAVWSEHDGLGYRAPKRGYLYYGCAKAHLRICRSEWADLRSVAGSGQMIGFGSRSLAAGRVRAADELALAPESYPIQFGVVQLGSAPRGAIFDQLKALARVK
jgi:hypothetical protein